MGSPVPPDPGDFTEGGFCETCEEGDHSIFLPNRTPLHVKMEILDGGSVIETAILTQHAVFKCEWYKGTLPDRRYIWANYNGGVGQTFVQVYWQVLGLTKRSFRFLGPPSCSTLVPNNEGSPEAAGDHARITWGEGIEP